MPGRLWPTECKSRDELRFVPASLAHCLDYTFPESDRSPGGFLIQFIQELSQFVIRYVRLFRLGVQKNQINRWFRVVFDKVEKTISSLFALLEICVQDLQLAHSATARDDVSHLRVTKNSVDGIPCILLRCGTVFCSSSHSA